MRQLPSIVGPDEAEAIKDYEWDKMIAFCDKVNSILRSANGVQTIQIPDLSDCAYNHLKAHFLKEGWNCILTHKEESGYYRGETWTVKAWQFTRASNIPKK